MPSSSAICAAVLFDQGMNRGRRIGSLLGCENNLGRRRYVERGRLAVHRCRSTASIISFLRLCHSREVNDDDCARAEEMVSRAASYSVAWHHPSRPTLRVRSIGAISLHIGSSVSRNLPDRCPLLFNDFTPLLHFLRPSSTMTTATDREKVYPAGTRGPLS